MLQTSQDLYPFN